MRPFPGIAPCLCLLAGPLFAAAAEAPTPVRLAAGSAIESALASGETHLYLVATEAGAHPLLTVDQRGVDVVVKVTAADGGSFRIDGPTPLRSGAAAARCGGRTVPGGGCGAAGGGRRALCGGPRAAGRCDAGGAAAPRSGAARDRRGAAVHGGRRPCVAAGARARGARAAALEGARA